MPELASYLKLMQKDKTMVTQKQVEMDLDLQSIKEVLVEFFDLSFDEKNFSYHRLSKNKVRLCFKSLKSIDAVEEEIMIDTIEIVVNQNHYKMP